MVMVELESSRIVGNVVTVWINVEIYENYIFYHEMFFCDRQGDDEVLSSHYVVPA